MTGGSLEEAILASFGSVGLPGLLLMKEFLMSPIVLFPLFPKLMRNCRMSAARDGDMHQGAVREG